MPARPPQRDATGAGGAPRRPRRNALQLTSLLLGVLSLLLLCGFFFLAVVLVSLTLHDELPPETIEAAKSAWEVLDVIAVSSIAAAAGAVGLGIWGEVRRRRRGARGRWVGIVLGCGTLVFWAWAWLRR